jgi:hypothetical protein
MGSICRGTHKDTGIRKRMEADMRMGSKDAQRVWVAASERSLLR